MRIEVEKGANKKNWGCILALIKNPDHCSFALPLLRTTQREIMAHLAKIDFGSILREMNKSLSEKVKNRTLELREKNRELRKLNRIRSDFFANISHDIRTPLSLLTIPVETLRSDPGLSPQHKKAIDQVSYNLYRTISMINMLLDASKLESQKSVLNLEHRDLCKFTGQIVKVINEAIKERGFLIRTSFNPGEIFCYFDSEKIEKVINNLLSNAIKYNIDKEDISVQLYLENEVINLVITDHGKGISRSELPFIFLRYRQSTDEKGIYKTGTGLGLSIVKDFIEMHGGRISVRSQPDIETVFHVRLPQLHENDADSVNLGGELNVTMQKLSELSSQGFEQRYRQVLNISILIADSDLSQAVSAQVSRQFHVKEVNLGRARIIITDYRGYRLANLAPNHLLTPFIIFGKRPESTQMSILAEYIAIPFHEAELEFKIKSLLRLEPFLTNLKEPLRFFTRRNRARDKTTFVHSPALVIHESLKELNIELPGVDIEFIPGCHKLHHRSAIDHIVYLTTSEDLKKDLDKSWQIISNIMPNFFRMVIIAKDDISKSQFAPIADELIHMVLPGGCDDSLVQESILNAFYLLKITGENLRLESQLVLSYQDVKSLTQVGQALSSEHDLDKLIALILDKSRSLVSADGGTIYLVERESNRSEPTHIRFKKSALNLNTDEFLLPIDKNSIAGYVALTGEELIIDDVYAISEDEDYHFNYEFDKAHDYHTKSMMVIPMKNHHDNVIGILQLINRKKDFKKTLTAEEMKGDEVTPFTQKDYEMVTALAGQAAVAIENNLLLQDINNLFEGFVKASVTAIEQRDPTTSGHSFRVAEFTEKLARSLERAKPRGYETVSWSAEQLREMRYASLLHDFGKVGVREQVLVKANKLYEHELELIRWRFHYIRKALINEHLEKKITYLKNNGNSDFDQFEKYIDMEYKTKLEDFDNMFQTILNANKPSVMEEGNFSLLNKIAKHSIRLDDGTRVPFLKNNELLSLSIRKGSLNTEERTEIESHVTHTYEFLIQIPWTHDLRNVPDIAYGHHEKLDGSGYPLQLDDKEITVQTRMMTISDIYDALTAWDRPYKKAISTEKALDILYMEVKDGHIDKRLLDVFVESKSFEISEIHYDRV